MAEGQSPVETCEESPRSREEHVKVLETALNSGCPGKSRGAGVAGALWFGRAW